MVTQYICTMPSNTAATRGIEERVSDLAIALRLTIRLSDAGLRRHPTKLIYPNHRLPPWLTEDAAPRSLEPIVRRPTHSCQQECPTYCFPNQATRRIYCRGL